jgi:integrase
MTNDRIKSAAVGEELWDDAQKGLHLRVLKDGKRVFYLYYRSREGRQRKPKIGEFGDITLGEARKRAKALMDRVAIGEDPMAEWDKKKAELTVTELWEKVWTGYWDTERFKKSGWARECKRYYEQRIKGSFGGLKLTEVTPGMVREWHAKGKDHPYAANRALAVFGRMLQWAEEHEFKALNSNPCLVVKKHPEAERERYAGDDEIAKLVPLIEKHGDSSPAGKAFLYLLMFTGSRPRAIERATWDQLQEFEADGQRFGILTFEGKSTATTGEKEKVVLPPQAMAALDALPRVRGKTITGIKLPRRLWRKVKEEAGCNDLWARDWRRTFATVGMSDGMEKGMIGTLLNHRNQRTTDKYAKLVDPKRVQVASKIAERIEALSKGKKDGDDSDGSSERSGVGARGLRSELAPEAVQEVAPRKFILRRVK